MAGQFYPLEGPLTCSLISTLIDRHRDLHGQAPTVVKVNPMTVRGEPIPKMVNGVSVRQNGTVGSNEICLE